MQFREVDYGGAQPVDGYGPGFFRVGGQIWQGAVVLKPGETLAWSGYDDPAPLLALAGQVDVLIIGTGDEIALLPPGLRRDIEDAGLAIELMASPPAARTYNVLLGEGRRVAAALLPVS